MSRLYKRQPKGFPFWIKWKSTKPLNLPPHRQSWNPCAMAPQRTQSEKREMGCHWAQHPVKRGECYWRGRRWSRCWGQIMFTVPCVDQELPGYKEGRRQGGTPLSPCCNQGSAHRHGSVWWGMSISLPHPPQHSDMIYMWEPLLSSGSSFPTFILEPQLATGTEASKGVIKSWLSCGYLLKKGRLIFLFLIKKWHAWVSLPGT